VMTNEIAFIVFTVVKAPSACKWPNLSSATTLVTILVGEF
jgi:hypothetical protein